LADRRARAKRWRASWATSFVWSEPDQESDLERLTDSFHLNLTAFGLLSFFVGLLSSIRRSGWHSSSGCRCCGPCAPAACLPRLLNTVLVAELVTLALVAGVVGLVCGYLIAAQLLPMSAASLRGLYGAQMFGRTDLEADVDRGSGDQHRRPERCRRPPPA